jgi:hypothetical protein
MLRYCLGSGALSAIEPVVKPFLLSAFMSLFFLHLLSSNHKSTHPCCNAAQKIEMRWTTTMKISSRDLRCPRSIACGVGLFRCCSLREST